MIRLEVHEAKTHLSRYLDEVEAGEVVLLCRRNVPIAKIRRVAPGRGEPRPVGLGAAAYGPLEIPDGFYEPLPDDTLDAFEGR